MSKELKLPLSRTTGSPSCGRRGRVPHQQLTLQSAYRCCFVLKRALRPSSARPVDISAQSGSNSFRIFPTWNWLPTRLSIVTPILPDRTRQDPNLGPQPAVPFALTSGSESRRASGPTARPCHLYRAFPPGTLMECPFQLVPSPYTCGKTV